MQLAELLDTFDATHEGKFTSTNKAASPQPDFRISDEHTAIEEMLEMILNG